MKEQTITEESILKILQSLPRETPTCKYMKCSWLTRQWLRIRFEESKVAQTGVNYWGIEVKEDQRMKNGKLRLVFTDGTHEDISVEPPLSQRYVHTILKQCPDFTFTTDICI